MRIAPKLLATGQFYAKILAVRRVIPQALLILDEYDLNLNQVKNVNSFLTKRWETSKTNDVRSDLFMVRRAGSPIEYTERRNLFEKRWFHHFTFETYPRLFENLYYTENESVADCLNGYGVDTDF